MLKEGVNKTANTKGGDFQLWFLKLNSLLTAFKDQAHFCCLQLLDIMLLEGLYLFRHEVVILVPQGILERLTQVQRGNEF